jgi:hypothetical protein
LFLKKVSIVLIGLRALPQGGDVLVKWETEFEKDSKRFELERSPNGVDWQNCSSIDANGQEVAYEYLDPSAFSFTGRPTLFYRLKIIDQEGNYTYSNIQTVNYKWAEDIFSISPNPVDDLLRVDLKSIFSGSMQIDVLSVRGRLLWSGMMEVEKGNNAYQLAMGAFPSGMYLLRMRMNDQVLTKRIVVD